MADSRFGTGTLPAEWQHLGGGGIQYIRVLANNLQVRMHVSVILAPLLLTYTRKSPSAGPGGGLGALSSSSCLQGTLPAAWSALKNLTDLIISRNEFTG